MAKSKTSLLPQATLDNWTEVLKVLAESSTYAEAASKLGMRYRTLHRKLKRMAARGYSPQLAPRENPAGMSTGKVTQQIGPDGTLEREWRRFSPTAQCLEEYADSLIDSLGRGMPKITKLPPVKRTDILGLAVMTDLHIGKFSYAKETGDDFDTDIAVGLGLAAMEEFSDFMGKASDVVLAVNGDHWHADNRTGTTEKSGNILDMDSRYCRNLDAGIDLLTASVEMLLKQGRRVHIVVVPGNHDWHTCHCASRILAAWFRNNKRVSVDVTHGPRKVVLHGKCMIGLAHGDGVKPKDWAQVMAVDPVTMPHWSNHQHRYQFLGHIHRRLQFAPIEVDEQKGVHVEYLQALCAADAWHYEHGYIGSGRKMDCMIFDAEYGMQGRAVRDVAQLAKRAGLA